MTAHATTTSASARRWLALVLLCAAQFMVVLDFSIVNVALPSIQEELGFSQESLQWVVSGYALTFGGFLLLGGRTADLFGRRRVFVAGLTLFSLASLAGGLAGSEIVLIGARFAQGLGAAIISPSAMSIITTTFAEGAERNRALGVWGAVGASGVAAGVILGGVLTDALSWRWVMFVNVPIGAAAIALAPVLLAESRDQTAATGLDLPGAISITGGLGALVYAFSTAEEAGFFSLRTASLFLLASALIVAFVLVESRTRAPLVPLRIFRLRSLTGANGVAFLASASFAPTFFVLSLYMQGVLGYRAIGTGLAFLPMAMVLIAASGVVGPRFVERVGVKPVAVAALATLGAGLLLFAFTLSADGAYLVGVLPAMAVVGVGMGFAFPAFIVASVAGVGDEEQGLASGLINTAQQVGAALGLAILVTVAASRTEVLDGVDPALALTGGFRWAFFAGAGLALAGAAVALLVLRERECTDALEKRGRNVRSIAPTSRPCP